RRGGRLRDRGDLADRRRVVVQRLERPDRRPDRGDVPLHGRQGLGRGGFVPGRVGGRGRRHGRVRQPVRGGLRHRLLGDGQPPAPPPEPRPRPPVQSPHPPRDPAARMQNIVIAEPYKFVPPYTGNFWTYPLRWWLPGMVRRSWGVEWPTFRGLDRLRASFQAG